MTSLLPLERGEEELALIRVSDDTDVKPDTADMDWVGHVYLPGRGLLLACWDTYAPGSAPKMRLVVSIVHWSATAMCVVCRQHGLAQRVRQALGGSDRP